MQTILKQVAKYVIGSRFLIAVIKLQSTTCIHLKYFILNRIFEKILTLTFRLT